MVLLLLLLLLLPHLLHLLAFQLIKEAFGDQAAVGCNLRGKSYLRSAYRSAELLSAWPLHAGRALDQLHALHRNQSVLNRRRGPRRRGRDLKWSSSVYSREDHGNANNRSSVQHWKPQRGEELAGEGAGCSSSSRRRRRRRGSNLAASRLSLPPYGRGACQLLPGPESMQQQFCRACHSRSRPQQMRALGPPWQEALSSRSSSSFFRFFFQTNKTQKPAADQLRAQNAADSVLLSRNKI